LPTKQNWFSASEFVNSEWSEFGEFCEEKLSGGSIFEKAIFGRSRRRKIQRVAPEVSEIPGFITDTHVHLLRKKLVNSEVKNFAKKAVVVKSPFTIDIEDSSYVLRFRSLEGDFLEISTKNLLLASGAIGNALLLGLITGQKVFPIGNHASAMIAAAEFRNRRSLRGFGALVPWGIFKSWSRSLVGDFNHSFRISPTSTLKIELGSILESFQHLKIVSVVRKITELFWTYSLLRPATGYIFGVLDTGRHAEIRLDNPRACKTFEVKVLQKDYLNSAKLDFDNLMQGLNSEGSIQVAQSTWPVFEDSHHYFGSCPMIDGDAQQLSVRGDFQVRGFPGLYAFGASSFPRGSHGHPTFLAVKTAEFAVRSILNGGNRHF
jgi:hypothetical protein